MSRTEKDKPYWVLVREGSWRTKMGYPPAALAAWAKRAEAWSRGATPEDLAPLAAPAADPPKSRDVFVFMINGFKPKAPAAAMALIDRL